jgi:hypothetical protein
MIIGTQDTIFISPHLLMQVAVWAVIRPIRKSSRTSPPKQIKSSFFTFRRVGHCEEGRWATIPNKQTMPAHKQRPQVGHFYIQYCHNLIGSFS